MSNINVTYTENTISVDETTTNIIVTDGSNVAIGNISTTTTNVTVTETPTIINVSTAVGISNAEIRAKFSASDPILYNESNGNFSFNTNASFLEKYVPVNRQVFDGSVVTLSQGPSGQSGFNPAGVFANSEIAFGNVFLSTSGLLNPFTGFDYDGSQRFLQSFVNDWQTGSSGALSGVTIADPGGTSGVMFGRYKRYGDAESQGAIIGIKGGGSLGISEITANNLIRSAIILSSRIENPTIFRNQQVGIGTQSSVARFGVQDTNTLGAAQFIGNVIIQRSNNQPNTTFKFGDFDAMFQLDHGTSNVITARAPLTSNSNITTTANVQGNFFIGDGSQLTNLASLNNAQVIAHIATVPLTVGGNLTVNGNINATGNINVQNVEDLYVRDQIIVLNANAASPANVQIISNRPGEANTDIKWNEQTDRWTFSNDGTTYYNLAESTTDIAEGDNLYFTDTRANSAIDTRVDKAFVDALGVDYNSLANTPTAVSEFTNDAGYLVAANLVSTTANVDSVNGATGVVVLDTDDISEGNTNLYYTDSRANSAIGAYQGDISTPGTITAATANATTVNATTVNVTDLDATNNVTVLGKLNAADGSNIAFVRAFSGDFAQTNTATGLNIVLEGESNNRISVADAGQFRYVPATRTLLVNDGTIGASAANTSFSGVNLLLTGNINAGSGNMSVGNISVNTVTAGFLSGNGVNITAITGANVFGLVTTQVSEGDNLYFTTERANTAIDARVVGSENIDVTSGVISLTNALGNVNSVTAEASTNLTLNSDNKLVLTQNFKGREVAPSGNIEHDGYAFFAANDFRAFNRVTYTGNAEIKNFRITSGNTTIGSNVITDVFAVESGPGGVAANIADIAVNSVWVTGPSPTSYPFPKGTVITSVDAANNTIFMSADAVATQDLSFEVLPINYRVGPALIDSSTGQAIQLFSEYDVTGSGSKTTLDSSDVAFTGIYGYPQSGFDISDFDIITAGVAGDYSLADTSIFMVGRNKLSAPKTALQAPAGLIVGNNADLTNRAENDRLPNFGINVLWDGTDTSYLNPPQTQILVKSYTDNGFQGSSAAQRPRGGPRLFFTAAEGNAAQPFQETYPRENLELGRVTWWSATAALSAPSTIAPPAWISGVTGQDCLTTNSGVGMYFGNSPNVNNFNRGLYFANTKGNTMIAGGPFASSKITFAKMTDQGFGANNGNSVAIYNTTMNGTLFADIGHADTSAASGSRFTVTNGGSAGAGVVGDMALMLNRKDNSGGAHVTNKTWDIVLEEQSEDLKFKANAVTVATITDAGNIVASNFIGNVDGNVTGFVSSISNFTTSDLAEGTNLYYTDSRARASISGTGDISYDANTGVISYIGTPGDITDVNAGDGLTGGGDSGNVTLAVGAGTGITVNADNVAVNMAAFSTTDLAEGTNLYYTDTRANSAIDARVDKAYVDGLGVDYNSLANTPTLAAVATSGDYDDLINTPTAVSEFTNDAGYLVAANITSLTANVDSVNGATGVVVLDTDDISEGNTNLYYTDTRANTAIDSRVNKAFVEGLGISYTSLTDKPVIPTHTSNLTNDSGFITSATANVVSVNGATGVVVLDTGDIAENGNLYFTTDRANTAIDSRVNTAFVNALSVDYNSLANAPTAVSAFTNDAGYLVSANLASLTANVDSVNGATGVVVLDTDDVAEGNTNLYYTTDRANTAIGAYQGNINTTGTVTATEFIGGGSDLTDVRAETIETTVKNISGVAIDKGFPLHAVSATPGGTPEVILADASNAATMPAHFIAGEDLAIEAEGRGILSGDIRGIDTATPGFSVGDTIFVAAGGGYVNVAPAGEGNIIQNLGLVTRVDATQGGGKIYGAGRGAATPNLNSGNIFIGNGSNQSVTATLDTGIVPENGNLYFTDARANAAMDAYLTSITANVDSVNGATGVVTLNTDDIAEGTANLYYSNARVNSFIQDNITTSDIDEGTNLYFTTARANSAISAYQGNIDTAGTIKGNTISAGNATLSTFDNQLGVSTPGVYFNVGGVTDTNAGFSVLRPVAGVSAFLLWNEAVDKWQFSNGDDIFYDMATSTTDLAEGTNLYYTDARANAAMDAYLTSITANVDSVNGATGVVVLDTDDIAEGSNLYYSNARVITAVETGNIKLKQFAETVVDLGNISGDISGNIDVANGTIYEITANGNITIDSLANAVAGTSATLIVTQDSTGGHILSSTMKFAGASKTLSTAPDSIDIISVFYDGATYYATLSKGYA